MAADKTSARVIDDLAPALKAGILEELGPGSYRFSHALVRDAIEATLSVPERAAAHARAEGVLATLPDSPKIAVERARHALAALTPDRVQHVRALAERAIAVLEQQGTYDRASALCRQLHEISATGALPASTSGDLVRASRLALSAGHFGESRKLALEAAAVARASGDADAFAAAALALGAQIHPGMIDTDVVAHLAEAQRVGPKPGLRCRVAARHAAAIQPALDARVPVEMARVAIADARKMKDPVLLEEVLFVAIAAMVEFVSSEEVRSLNLEHLALALQRQDADRTIRTYVRLAFNDGELGDFAAFDQRIDEMLQLASNTGHPRVVWRAQMMASMRANARGQFAESERYIAELERATQLTDDPSLSSSIPAHKFYRSLDLHRENAVNGALPHLRKDLEKLPSGPWLTPLVEAQAAARFGDIDRVARAMAGAPFERLHGMYLSPAQLAMYGEVYAAHGTVEQRRALLDRVAPLADRHVFIAQAPMAYGGPMRRIVGLLEASLGNRTIGEQHLRRALETCRAAGFATWVARLSFEVGDTEDAARLANSLGIRGLARRASMPGESVAPTTKPSLELVREGPVWRIRYGVRAVLVADNRGMELISKLVERPGEDIHVLVLSGTGGDALVDSDAGEQLDARAARSYRDRVAAIDEALEAAKPERATQLIAERDFLQSELSRAFGLGNAPRRSGSISERARVNVQRRIKDSLSRIASQDTIIADYLRAAIRTGTYCTFRP